MNRRNILALLVGVMIVPYGLASAAITDTYCNKCGPKCKCNRQNKCKCECKEKCKGKCKGKKKCKCKCKPNSGRI